MALRCVYTDLDGTLLGKGASLFRDGDGGFTLLPARALEACHRAGVEVVLKSGRRKAQVMEDARIIGQTSYIYEVGSGLVIDGEEQLLVDPFAPEEGRTPHELIAATGAPALLLGEYAGSFEEHTPWHVGRYVSHVFRGRIDVPEANGLLEGAGHAALRLVDNGESERGGGEHTYHLIPATASKAAAVELHMRARGLSPRECIAVGDSAEDLGVAPLVGSFYLVANAPSGIGGPDVERTESGFGDGFYEAVVRSLVE